MAWLCFCYNLIVAEIESRPIFLFFDGLCSSYCLWLSGRGWYRCGANLYLASKAVHCFLKRSWIGRLFYCSSTSVYDCFAWFLGGCGCYYSGSGWRPSRFLTPFICPGTQFGTQMMNRLGLNRSNEPGIGADSSSGWSMEEHRLAQVWSYICPWLGLEGLESSLGNTLSRIPELDTKFICPEFVSSSVTQRPHLHRHFLPLYPLAWTCAQSSRCSS